MPPARLAFLFLALLPVSLPATDWPQWRGPARDGSASAFRAPAAWTPASLRPAWSVPVGEGHASPVVVGDRVHVFSREGEQEVLRCLELADGREIWKEAYPAPYEMTFVARKHGKGPKATPVVAGGRVFALGIAGHLSAWEAATGRVLWRKEFAGEFKATAPEFGAAASPLVDGGVVIAHVGGKDRGALTAFDTATGAVRWRWDGDGPGYASPVIANLGGVRQLITQTQRRCVALNPADGRLLWELPFTTAYEQNSVTPLVVGELVVFGGVGKPTFAVEVVGGQPKVRWEAREISLYMSTPVLAGPRLFGMTDKTRGALFSLDARSGAVLWRGEGRLGENASLTDVGGVLLVLTTGGELSVQVPAGDELRAVARYPVSTKPVWASPAVAGQRILVKDFDTLTAHAVEG